MNDFCPFCMRSPAEQLSALKDIQYNHVEWYKRMEKSGLIERLLDTCKELPPRPSIMQARPAEQLNVDSQAHDA